MKDKLSSVLSEIKKKSFVCHAGFILFLAALTAASLSFAVARHEMSTGEAQEVFEPEIAEDVPQEPQIAQDEQEAEEPEQTAEKEYIPVGDIRIPHCDAINYPLSTKVSDFYFENPSTNACYLKVSITRLDTKENIYSSNLISPGKSVSGISLKLPSRQASYNAMIKVDAYALDRMVHLNSLAIDTVIYAY